MELRFTFLLGLSAMQSPPTMKGRVMEHHGISILLVADISRGDFDTVLRAFGRRNRHGGYALRADGGLDWDVWRLEETIGLRKTGTPCSIENVLRTFNLDWQRDWPGPKDRSIP